MIVFKDRDDLRHAIHGVVNKVVDEVIQLSRGSDKRPRAMIIQPMHNKTEDEILAIRDQAKREMEQLGYVVIDTFFKEDPGDLVRHSPLYFLGKSLDCMSQCEAVYLCNGWASAPGCALEYQAATNYGLEIICESADTTKEACTTMSDEVLVDLLRHISYDSNMHKTIQENKSWRDQFWKDRILQEAATRLETLSEEKSKMLVDLVDICTKDIVICDLCKHDPHNKKKFYDFKTTWPYTTTCDTITTNSSDPEVAENMRTQGAKWSDKYTFTKS